MVCIVAETYYSLLLKIVKVRSVVSSVTTVANSFYYFIGSLIDLRF